MTNPNKHSPEHPKDPSKPADKWQKIAQEAEPQAAAPGAQPEPEAQLDFPSRQQLEDRLTALERQMDEYKQQSLRAQAELDNVRRRAERDVSNAHKYGTEQLIGMLLPVADSMIRGLESGDAQDPKVKTLHDGMQMTLDLLIKALIKCGVEVIDPAVGAPFDPKLHEAMGMQHDPNAKPNTILKVLQKGFQLHGRVLRAAMVMVAQ